MLETFFTIGLFLLQVNPVSASSTQPVEPLTVEEKIVKELGSEFITIAKCESGMKQFKEDGTVLISPSSDVGLFQINQVHWDTAKKMEIDIYTVDGNIAYAKFLKEQNGYGDWYMSKHCHGY